MDASRENRAACKCAAGSASGSRPLSGPCHSGKSTCAAMGDYCAPRRYLSLVRVRRYSEEPRAPTLAKLTELGRSLRDCQHMFNHLLQRSHSQSFPLSAPPASQSFPPAFPQHRPYVEHSHLQPQLAPRAIQPRPSPSTDSPNPASTNGESLTIVSTVGPEISGERRKKRGRPTKEEVEERSALLAAEGKVYEPKKRPLKKFRASTGTPIPTSERVTTPAAEQTPLLQTIETKDDSSSGKRRSQRRSSVLESHTQVEPSSPTTRAGEEKSAESPSDRLLARWNPHEREPDRPSGPGGPSAAILNATQQ